MAHLLLLDVPGGNDFTVLEDAVNFGHEVTFYTSDLSLYNKQGDSAIEFLKLAREVIETTPDDYEALELKIMELHSRKPIDAVICLIDIRIIEASLLSQKLGLRFLNPASARLMRDKFSVREILAKKEIRQPKFAIAHTIEELRTAVSAIGFPALIKPSDGYGSQNIFILRSIDDFNTSLDKLTQIIEKPTDYGLGIHANNRFLVEQYIEGKLIGCDIFSDGISRKLIGINDKLMFPAPSFAIRGSCFPSNRYDMKKIRDYAFAILDAVNFDFGASHIEMMVTEDGPYLVEVNPRLVSAQIPYQMGYALERSIYNDLINLHLGSKATAIPKTKPNWFSAIRWFTASRNGILENIEFPQHANPLVRRVAIFKQLGDKVSPPMSNGDRIGYVIAVGKTQEAAEQLANNYLSKIKVELVQ